MSRWNNSYPWQELRDRLDQAEFHHRVEARWRVEERSRSRCSFCGDLTGRLGPSGHRCAGCDTLVAQARAETWRERALALRNGYDTLARTDYSDVPIEYRTHPGARVLTVR